MPEFIYITTLLAVLGTIIVVRWFQYQERLAELRKKPRLLLTDGKNK